MSAVKPATDKEIDDLIRTCRLNAAPDTIWGRVLQEGALKLAARIAADAARIRELEARQVPDGWQVVPKEPTRAMHDASNEVLGMPWRSVVPPGISHDDYVRQHEWAAMLAAAPRP